MFVQSDTMQWSSVTHDLNEHSRVQNGAQFTMHVVGKRQILFTANAVTTATFFCYHGITVVFYRYHGITVEIYPFIAVIPWLPLYYRFPHYHVTL